MCFNNIHYLNQQLEGVCVQLLVPIIYLSKAGMQLRDGCQVINFHQLKKSLSPHEISLSRTQRISEGTFEGTYSPKKPAEVVY